MPSSYWWLRIARAIILRKAISGYLAEELDPRLSGKGEVGPGGRDMVELVLARQAGTQGIESSKLTRVIQIPQRLLGPKPFPLDRLLAMFASLYAEHATRPLDLEPSYDYSSDEDGDQWLPSVEHARKREERRRKRDTEREELWEDEVDHLTMSIGLWSMVSDPC